MSNARCYYPTRYYFGRTWKISWFARRIGPGRMRLVKHYERRDSGGDWLLVRSIVNEIVM